jgi:hypothetical protein
MSKRSENYSKLLSEVSGMLNKVKTLNETISFDEEYDIERDNEFDDVEASVGEPAMVKVPEKECVGAECDDIDEATDIDMIREIALKGMLKYVKQSNSAEYETLKKIFQFCDKVNNDRNSVEEGK